MPNEELNIYANQERRKADADAHAILHEAISDVKKTVDENSIGLTRIEGKLKGINTAFMKNDIENVDYDGHRRDHLAIKKSHEVMDNYKYDVTKKLITYGLIFILGAVATATFSWIIHVIKVASV